MTKQLFSRPTIELEPVDLRYLELKGQGLEGDALREAMPKHHGAPLSDRQIGRYAARARQRLGATTTEQAIVVAVGLGLIRTVFRLRNNRRAKSA